MIVGGTVDQLWSLAAGQASDEDDATTIVKLIESWADVTIADRSGDDD